MIDTYEKYLEFMENEVVGEKPKLLLHACCAPCSSACIERLKERFDITIFYFNPCIYPLDEYDKRGDQFSKLGIDKFIKCEYDHNEYLEYIKGLEGEQEGGKRCYKCYEERLWATSKFAKENGYDFFSTTLSISPHKNSKWINEIGIRLGGSVGVDFLYSDFKKKDGYLRSIELSKKHDLYRQDYCGCEFSMRNDK